MTPTRAQLETLVETLLPNNTSGLIKASDARTMFNTLIEAALIKEDDFGVSAGEGCEGNDGRLSNNRTPVDASVSIGKLSADVLGRLNVATLS